MQTISTEIETLLQINSEIDTLNANGYRFNQISFVRDSQWISKHLLKTSMNGWACGQLQMQKQQDKRSRFTTLSATNQFSTNDPAASTIPASKRGNILTTERRKSDGKHYTDANQFSSSNSGEHDSSAFMICEVQMQPKTIFIAQ